MLTAFSLLRKFPLALGKDWGERRQDAAAAERRQHHHAHQHLRGPREGQPGADRAGEREIIDVSYEAFRDDDGYVTTQRLREAFATIGALGDVNDEDMARLIDDIDESGDGKIDEDEFRSVMTRKLLGEDDDPGTFGNPCEDGYIPLPELREVLMKEGENPLTEHECDELMMLADLEGDGLIEYKSFLRWLVNPDGH
ncbi:unnamed protein product [Prorocentrum cordatum]|uniref:EF-hand domain-containing protein n=1 Tax=Prorocentrum cordatum TaxID=2364126 RepID=A0ABN9XKC2_9DINO|nr:unnamed protein product [Polarella glacialis]